jgi:hypothetical protein
MRPNLDGSADNDRFHGGEDVVLHSIDLHEVSE